MTIALASASPRRLEILQESGFSVTVIPNNLQTEVLPSSGTLCQFKKHISHLALQKAKISRQDRQQIVVAADTVVVFGRLQFGKPTSKNHALSMLRCLAGQTHRVITGVAFLSPKVNFVFSETSEVTFKPLTQTQIEEFVTKFEVMDKAGSYGIQDCKEEYVDHLKGSYFNVMGFPIETFCSIFAKYGLKG